MATRRSKKNTTIEKLSADESETTNNAKETEGSVPEIRTSARILRSKGRNASKEKSSADSTKTESAKEKGVGNSPELSPSRKRSRRSPSKRVSKAMRIPLEEEEEEGEGEEEEEENESVAEEDQLARKSANYFERDTSVIELSSDDDNSPSSGKQKGENINNRLESDEDPDDPKISLPSKFTDTSKDLSKSRHSAASKPSITKESSSPVTIQVKKVIKGADDGEIRVVTSYEELDNAEKSDEWSNDRLSPGKVTRTYPGRVGKVRTVTKTEGRKYMILDKATIKGMMEKGLIQAINKDESGHENITYRAILPKAGPSILRRVAGPESHLKSPPGVKPNILTSKGFIKVGTGETNASELESATVPVKTSVSVRGSSTIGTAVAQGTALPGTRLQIPSTSVVAKASGSGIGQVVTTPVFVKSGITGGSVPGPTPGNMQVVTLPPNFLNQIQKGGSLLSLAMTDNSAGEKTVLQTASTSQSIAKTPSRNTFIVSTAGSKSSIQSEDLDEPDVPVDGTDSGEDEDKDVKYGVPTGVCKVLKSMRMYQFVDKGTEEKGSQGVGSGVKNSHNVRWVAVPNDPGEPRPDFGPKIQRCTPPILPINVPSIMKEPPAEAKAVGGGGGSKCIPADVRAVEGGNNKKTLRRLIKDMKLQHARLIGKHRTRFSRLQKKYSELEKDFKEVEDVGTAQQIVRDCKKHLSEEHALFMESQMFWKNIQGKGNRFSKRFLLLMLDLYHKSPAGYRYLKTVFTLPSIKLLLKLESYGFGSRSSAQDPLATVENSNVQTPDGESSISPDNDEDSNLEPPVGVTIKSEVPVMTESDSLTMPTDSKDWFKSDMMISESLPSTSGQTMFLGSSVKETLLHQKRPDEEEDLSSHHATSDNLELSEVGSTITTFDNISKKVVVVPDNGSLNKQEITIQWDEAWGPL